MKTRSILYTTLTCLTFCSAGLLAQAEDKAFDIEYGKKIIDKFEADVAVQQKRVDGMTEELVAMDAGIEKKIDSLIVDVAAVKDSVDSGTRIENSKMELVEGLQKSIRFYQQRRAAKNAKLARPGQGAAKDDLKKDVAFLDARTDKRINQIMELAQSFAQHENHEKYIYEYKDTAFKNWYYQDKDINPEYKQNKNATQVSNKSRRHLIEDAQKAIDKLKRKNVIMQNQIRGASSRADYDRRVAEMERNETLIEELADSIDKLVSTGSSSKATPKDIGDKNKAHKFDIKVRETIADIQKDYRAMLAKKSRLDLERTRLNGVRSKLTYNQNVLARLSGKKGE